MPGLEQHDAELKSVSVALRAGLVAACDDAQLLGVPLTDDQRRRLELVERHRTNWWAVGRRGLKTTSMAYVGLWCCLLRPELLGYLRPGERGYCVGIATNHRASGGCRAVGARPTVERSPLLAPLVESVTEDDFGPRGVMHSWATDTDDPTEEPRWGRVGKQKIEDTGPLARSA